MVVMGASYTGLGIASICENTLLLEEGEMLGSDYHLSFRPVFENHSPENKKTKELYDFLKAQDIINKEEIDILTMSTAICKFSADKGLHQKVIFNARLMECVPFEDGYRVTYYSNTGVHTVFAQNVVDTSSLRNSARNLAEMEQKYLHAVCTDLTDEAVKKIKNSGATLTKGFLPKEYFVTFKFDADMPLIEARFYVENTWQKLFPSGEFLIDAVSFNFDTLGIAIDGDAPLWIAPHNFENPLSAFDAGCFLAEKKGW